MNYWNIIRKPLVELKLLQWMVEYSRRPHQASWSRFSPAVSGNYKHIFCTLMSVTVTMLQSTVGCLQMSSRLLNR